MSFLSGRMGGGVTVGVVERSMAIVIPPCDSPSSSCAVVV